MRILSIAAGATALAAVLGFGATNALASDITLDVDGQTSQTTAFNATVAQVLAARGVAVGEHDAVAPALTQVVGKGQQITVRYGRPVTVIVDGVPVTRWSTALTVNEALTQFGINADDNELSTSRSLAIGREGISVNVTSAYDVTVTADGQTKPISTSGTVADALTAAGIGLNPTDKVTPALDTKLADGIQIKVVRVTTRLVSKEVPIPFSNTNTDDATLAKGTTKVTTPGVNGVSTETYTQTLEDGQVVSEERTASVVTTQPVNQVTAVGTKTAAAPATTTKTTTTSGSTSSSASTPASSSSTSTSSSSSSSSTASSGSNLTPATGNSCGVSFYDDHGSLTANGERLNVSAMTAAHKSLPFGTMVKVTNPSTGKSVVVRINDRGPYIAGRCLDLTPAAFGAIAPLGAGHITATWEVVG